MDLNKYNPTYSLVPAGFNNLGFTCYYNSLLQSLLSCPSFVEQVLKSDEKNPLIEILRYLICKIHELEKNTNEINLQEIHRLGPISWRVMIQKLAQKSHEFAQFAMGQQCAAEGFSLLLQSIEEYGNIQNLFMYRRRNKLFCEECKTHFSQVDEMNNIFEVEPMMIDAEIKKTRNLNEFLVNQKNQVDADCKCSKCGVKSEKQKTSTLVMIPEVLFVMAKKYKYENGQSTKLDVYTDFPKYLTFKSKNGASFKYGAVAQIEHLGASIDCGHYYAICKRKTGWFCLNDSGVNPAEFKPTNNTYIVVYHIF